MVGMMLEVRHKYDGPTGAILMNQGSISFMQLEAENLLEGNHRAGHAGATRNQDVVLGCANLAFDDDFGLLIAQCHRRAGHGCFSMGIANQWSKFIEQAFFNYSI